ncbi:uncharacterized protein V1518DRAFT_450943 [Limtongia smithiae]|uniref:uncharacterized protein n=1 Tax=Limtongia smithiae TaxID=1125753 RepID=UPI0034CD7E85
MSDLDFVFDRIAKEKISRHGSGIVATEDIPVGSTVADKRMAICVPETPMRSKTCAYCLVMADESAETVPTAVLKVSSCASCRMTWYCSKECQVKDWKQFHQLECKVFRQFAPKLPITLVMLMLRILSLPSKKQDKFLSIMDGMVSHFSLRKSHPEHTKMVVTMAQGTSQMTHSTIPLERLMVLIDKAFVNAATVVDPNFETVGIMLDNVISFFNHSCDPNVYLIFDRGRVRVRTARNITKGEELFISYIDNTQSYPERIEQLQKRYYFTCDCPSCVPVVGLANYDDVRNDFVCAKCKGRIHPYDSTSEAEDGLYNCIHECPHCKVELLGPTSMRQLDRKLRKSMLAKIDHIENQKQVKDMLKAIRDIRDLVAVPIYRSPISSAVQQLIPYLLSIDDMPTALKLISIEYFHQEPVLLQDQSVSPVRLAHTLRFVIVLLLHLRSEAQGTSVVPLMDGVDLHVCMCGLLEDIDRLIPLVYGPKSALGLYSQRLKLMAHSMFGNRTTSASVYQREMTKLKSLSLQFWDNI